MVTKISSINNHHKPCGATSQVASTKETSRCGSRYLAPPRIALKYLKTSKNAFHPGMTMTMVLLHTFSPFLDGISYPLSNLTRRQIEKHGKRRDTRGRDPVATRAAPVARGNDRGDRRVARPAGLSAPGLGNQGQKEGNIGKSQLFMGKLGQIPWTYRLFMENMEKYHEHIGKEMDPRGLVSQIHHFTWGHQPWSSGYPDWHLYS